MRFLMKKYPKCMMISSEDLFMGRENPSQYVMLVFVLREPSRRR